MSLFVALAAVPLLQSPVGLSAQELPRAKAIAAGPEDFAHLQLPHPSRTGSRSHIAMIPVHLEPTRDGGWDFQELLPIDGSIDVTLAFVSPDARNWDLRVEVERKELSLTSLLDDDQRTFSSRVTHRSSNLGSGQIPTELFRFDRIAPGLLPIRIKSESSGFEPGDDRPDGFLILSNEDGIGLYVHRLHHELTLGQDIGLAAYAFEKLDAAGQPIPLSSSLEVAEMRMVSPSGQLFSVEMHDDGIGADQEAGDGVFSADFTATEVGRYVAQVDARGVTPDGLLFRRTGEELMPVVPNPIQLGDDEARGLVLGDRLEILVPVEVTGTPRLQVGTEVWGLSKAGEMAPVAWVGGIVQPTAAGELKLTLDSGWLGLAGVSDQLELRSLRVQDVNTHAILARRDRMQLDADLPPNWSAPIYAITPKMQTGKRPIGLAQPGPSIELQPSPPLPAGLMLVHGYCSGGVWPTGDFTGFSVFQDINQSRSNDEFALLLDDSASQFGSYGVVAHSQGGLAALHLYTFYWSGLDNAVGSRLIQSVGSPYQGTALAGDLSLLGSIFGAGCGENADLTYTGSALWLANIPSWARDDVYYFTTSFFDGFFFDFCSLATDLFLDDPDDGVTEMAYGQLPGANNMGHKESWCHTTGMSDPAQYFDTSRNLSMDASAAR
ncbi:MAG: hypothetical protein ACI87A_003145 [Planctomycetota bacterium]|jgi:hypothetical protein